VLKKPPPPVIKQSPQQPSKAIKQPTKASTKEVSKEAAKIKQ